MRVLDKAHLCALLLLACVVPAAAQLSPGPLSRAHQDLEGVGSCAKCHDFGAGARSLRCLECHTEIQRRVTAKTGFHARAFRAASGQQDCARCHGEHNGTKFGLIRLDRKAFQHEAETGFKLEGKHRTVACETCHASKNISAPARAEIKLKDVNHSFLGLRRECNACHQDQHKGQLGSDCTKCHSPEGWKPAGGFNHTQARFALTGLHQQVACVKCHATPSQFKGLAFQTCESCHKDPHRGAFREAKVTGSCDSCHSTAGWRRPRIAAAGFSHDRTPFALKGKHADVACNKCHKDADFHRQIAHGRCSSCHQDPHNKQFASRAAGADCQSCHNENSFKPALFDRAMHQKSAFRLEARHAELDCAKCHQPQGREAVYITRLLACADCHNDPHRGEFASKQCSECHTQTKFKDHNVTVAAHAKTQFPLTGKHSVVACADCHKQLPTAPAAAAKLVLAFISAPTAARQFHFAATRCNSCHQDPHNTTLACESCHTSADWKTTAKFDHAVEAKFPLTGAHAKPNCVQCHQPIDAAKRPATPSFQLSAKECLACHQKDDRHGGQFQATGKATDCASCHAPESWKIEEFNHERTRFPLDRAHRNVTCAKCHKVMFNAGYRTYRNTPLECVRCH